MPLLFWLFLLFLAIVLSLVYQCGKRRGEREAAQTRAENRANGLETKSKFQGINTEALELTEVSTGADICGDNWEGIEKTELHLTFDRADKFLASVKCSSMISKIGIKNMKKLEELHKVATEGCPWSEPRCSFKLSMRRFSADANKWQHVGNMSPEDAMQQYIDIVSAMYPGWMDGEQFERNHAEFGKEQLPQHSLDVN